VYPPPATSNGGAGEFSGGGLRVDAGRSTGRENTRGSGEGRGRSRSCPHQMQVLSATPLPTTDTTTIGRVGPSLVVAGLNVWSSSWGRLVGSPIALYPFTEVLCRSPSFLGGTAKQSREVGIVQSRLKEKHSRFGSASLDGRKHAMGMKHVVAARMDRDYHSSVDKFDGVPFRHAR
jgi:hypothetical protein